MKAVYFFAGDWRHPDVYYEPAAAQQKVDLNPGRSTPDR